MGDGACSFGSQALDGGVGNGAGPDCRRRFSPWRTRQYMRALFVVAIRLLFIADAGLRPHHSGRSIRYVYVCVLATFVTACIHCLLMRARVVVWLVGSSARHEMAIVRLRTLPGRPHRT